MPDQVNGLPEKQGPIPSLTTPNSDNQNVEQQMNAAAIGSSLGDAPPPYSAPPSQQWRSDQITFDPTKMTRSKINDVHKDKERIEAMSLTNQWIEMGNNHKGEYDIGSLVMKNCKLEAKDFHIPQAKIGTLHMECGSIEAHNVHKAEISIGSLNIENGCIDFGNMHASSIKIGKCHLGNVTIKGKMVYDSELRIEQLIPSDHLHSSTVHLRPLQDVRVKLSAIDFSGGLDAVAFMEQIMMRGNYA